MRHKAASGFREDSGLGALVEGHPSPVVLPSPSAGGGSPFGPAGSLGRPRTSQLMPERVKLT